MIKRTIKTEYFKVNSVYGRKIVNARGGSDIVVNPNLTNWVYQGLTTNFRLPMDQYLKEFKQLRLKMNTDGIHLIQTKHLVFIYIPETRNSMIKIIVGNMIMSIKENSQRGVIMADIRNNGKIVATSKHIPYTGSFLDYVGEVIKRISVSF